ncbi:MAG: Uma2 family endonuclease [Vulcanimicrobiaceae bacterium]
MATMGIRRFNRADLERMPDDRNRYEVIDGVLVVSPSPNVAHQTVVVRLTIQLGAFAATTGGATFVAPLDVVLGEEDVVQPDVMYLAPDRLSAIGEKNVTGAPSLVIEVLSPSSYDTDPGEKRDLYARYGVPEYWIVDPRTHTIVAYATPLEGRFTRHETAHSGCLRSLTIDGLTLCVL